MSDDRQSRGSGPRILQVPTTESGVATDAELVFEAARDEPPLEGPAQRLARAIAADLLLYNAEQAKASGGGALPAALVDSVREGYALFVDRCGPGRAHGFAAALAEVSAEHGTPLEAAAILAALGTDAAQRPATTPSAAPGELRLVVRRGVEEGKAFRLQGEEVTVGRAQECAVCLPSGSLSRRHAVLLRKEDGWHVVDLTSANGTFVNDRSAETAVRIGAGDRLRFGDVECEVLDANGGGNAPQAAPRRPWWKFW